MKLKSEILAHALEYARNHPEFIKLLQLRDEADNVTIRNIWCDFLGEDDDEIFIEIKYDFKIIAPGALDKEDIVALTKYEKKTNTYKMIRVSSSRV